jgi:hypothetical protein
MTPRYATLLLFKAPGTSHLSDEDFVCHIWPAVEGANSQSKGFAQIYKGTIAILPDEIECPITDKSSIRRGQLYREFATIIDSVYNSSNQSRTGLLQLAVPELEAWILATVADMGHELRDADVELFSAGIDRLKEIQRRTRILTH